MMPLTQILQTLTQNKYRKDHALKGGLWLHWLPPNELRASRKGEIPSARELKTVGEHLKLLSYTHTLSNLKTSTNSKGEKWHYYRFVITHQSTMFQEPKSPADK